MTERTPGILEKLADSGKRILAATGLVASVGVCESSHSPEAKPAEFPAPAGEVQQQTPDTDDSTPPDSPFFSPEL